MTTEVNPRYIRCKECGKVWSDKDAYKNDPGCDKAFCLNTNEAIRMSRRRGRRGRTVEVPVPDDSPSPVVRLQVHRTQSQVLNNWDPKKPSITLIVPDAINVNIFPRYK
jgi:hypothetical protein